MSKTLNSVAKTPAPRAAKPAASKAPSAIQQAGTVMAALSVKTIKPVVQKPVKKVDPIAKPAPIKPLQAAVPAKDSRQYTTRMAKADRSNQILSAALKVAGKVGYIKMTRADVAAQAGVSECLITRYFATMDALRDAVVQSVQRECLNDDRPPVPANLRILAEALVAKHKDANKAAKKHKDAIVALLFK